ncbi:MAG: BACON domain-containing protein [Candidatus Cryptobacteroides sp.]
MKKSIIYAGVILAAFFTLTNCTKESGNADAGLNEGIPFEVYAGSADTKTEVDGLSTKWVAGDAINVFHAESGSTTYISDNEFTVAAEDIAVGRFSGNLSEALENANYDWYAFYPYSSYNKTPAGDSQENFGFTTIGGTSQTQEGNDSMAHLCGKTCPLYGVATNVSAGDTAPCILMKHLASVLAVKVKNTTAEPLTVSSVSFTGTEDIAGTYYINYAGSPVVYTKRGSTYVSSTASLAVKNGEPVASNSSATFYIAVKPFTASSGEKLTLSVNGYQKELTLTKDIDFPAGHIKTLSFDFDKVIADYVELPWEIDGKGGAAVWKNTAGLSQNGLGSDYTNTHSPYLTKMDDTGDYVQVKFDSPAKQVSFGLKMIGGSTASKIILQGSVDNGEYTDIESFDITGAQNSILSFNSSNEIDASYRFIRLTFTKGSNIGLGKVSISSTAKPSISIGELSEIGARGVSSGELEYTIENPDIGTSLSATCDGTIVTEVSDMDGKLTFNVSKNTTTAVRTGEITLTYGDIVKTVTVQQLAPVFYVSRTVLELDAAAGSQSSITLTSDFGWVADASDDTGFTFSPDACEWTDESYEAANGKTTITIKAKADNASEDGVVTLGTLTFTDELDQTLVVTVKQSSSVVSPETGIKFVVSDFSGEGLSGSGGDTQAEKSGILIYSDKGYIDGTTAVRVYSGGIIKITSTTGNITKIELTSTASGTSNNGPSKLSLQTGQSGTYSYSGNLSTWTGTSSEVIFKATAQYRFKEISVTVE